MAEAHESVITEEIVVWRGLPLRLVFCPDAIRQHFNEDPRVLSLPRETLLEIGAAALDDNALYAAFNKALCTAIEEQCGFNPDDGEDG